MTQPTQPRKMSDRSLQNLNPKARYLGKVNLQLTLKPDNIEWLKRRGNASALVDALVEYARFEHQAVLAENKRLNEQVQKEKKVYLSAISDTLTDLLTKSESGESGYRSNAFGQGLKVLRAMMAEIEEIS